MSWKQEPTMECPRCKEISFEHTDTYVGQGKRTLEFTCRCGELGYFDEKLPRGRPETRPTLTPNSLKQENGASSTASFTSNPLMNEARGYFDEL